MGQEGDSRLITGAGVRCNPHFSRRLRRLQIHFLMRRLLRAGERILVPTAGRAELFAYALIPEQTRQRGEATFYVHQMRMDEQRRRRLQWIARRAPETRILTTTDALAQSIREAGFQRVRSQPCPFAIPEEEPPATPFRQVIFPGVARMDKNLPLVVDLIALLHEKEQAIPVMLQAAPNHHGEYAPDVAEELARARAIGYPHLTLPGRAIHGPDYLGQFRGAVCLQPYRVSEYANKISGITLDALARGCPVLVRKGIWPATLVARFEAGVVIDSDRATDWLDALQEVVTRYDCYQARCRDAYHWLREHHGAHSLLATMEEL